MWETNLELLLLVNLMLEQTRASGENMDVMNPSLDILETIHNLGIIMCYVKCKGICSCRSFAYNPTTFTCGLLKGKGTHLGAGYITTVLTRGRVTGDDCCTTTCAFRCGKNRLNVQRCVDVSKNTEMGWQEAPSKDFRLSFLGKPDPRSCKTCNTLTNDCTAVGEWPGLSHLSRRCSWRKVKLPFSTRLPCDVQGKLVVKIEGYIKLFGAKRTSFGLCRGSDCFLYLSCQIKMLTTSLLATVNTVVEGKWGRVVTCCETPFTTTKTSLIIITLELGEYKVIIDDSHPFHFKERFVGGMPNALSIGNGINVKHVEILI